MAPQPAVVFVVVDRAFGGRLVELFKSEAVWIVDTPANRAVAKKLWADFPDRTHLNGVTLFDSVSDSAEDCAINELGTIDLHHGIDSSDRPYAGLQTVGVEPTPRLIAALALYGLTEITPVESGFRACRRF